MESNTFSPEFMAKLQAKAQFIEPAVKAISPFAKFPGPDGRYYADFHKIVGSFDSKTGAPVFTFAFIILADVETSSQTYIGYPARLRFACKASERQTEQEAWNRLFTDGYQAMGIQTQKWKNVMQDMTAATEYLNKSKFPVVLSIKKNKDGFTNFNITEVLSREAIKHLTVPVVSIQDDQLSADDEEGAALLDEVVDNFSKAFKEAEDFLNSADHATLLAQLAESKVEVADSASLTDVQLRAVILAHFVVQSDRDPKEFGLPVFIDGRIVQDENGDELLIDTAELVSSDEPATEADEPSSDSIMEALEEELEEEAPFDTCPVILLAMDRSALKKAIILYKADQKFYQNMTDESLREMLGQLVAANNNEIRWTQST